MPKKETFTDVEILEDIKNEIKDPKRLSEIEYQKSSLPSFLVVIALIVAVIICAVWEVCEIFLSIPLLIAYIVFIKLRVLYKAKKVRIENYEVTTATLLNTVDESHWEERASHYGSYRTRREWISYYVLRFEEFGYWVIPTTNYYWSKELRMQDGYIYENSHRGDEFIIVIEKKTKRIVVAYHTDYFEYRKTK